MRLRKEEGLENRQPKAKEDLEEEGNREDNDIAFKDDGEDDLIMIMIMIMVIMKIMREMMAIIIIMIKIVAVSIATTTTSMG